MSTTQHNGDTLKPYPFATLTEAHRRNACYYGNRGDWFIVYSRNRDSDCLEQSNFESMLRELGGESSRVAIERSSHWAVGWMEYLVVHPWARKLLASAIQMVEALEDYPVLDEQDYSNREWEEYQESWESWGRDEYRDALKARIYDADNDSNFESQLEIERKEALDDLTNEELDKLVEKARQGVNWKYQSEGSGVVINISGLADATDIDTVMTRCDELIAEQQRQQDIARLAYFLGACKAQVNEAVKLDIRTVSGLQALMQGMI